MLPFRALSRLILSICHSRIFWLSSPSKTFLYFYCLRICSSDSKISFLSSISCQASCKECCLNFCPSVSMRFPCFSLCRPDVFSIVFYTFFHHYLSLTVNCIQSFFAKLRLIHYVKHSMIFCDLGCG